jgi:hypothetical protein
MQDHPGVHAGDDLSGDAHSNQHRAATLDPAYADDPLRRQ